MVCVSQSRVRGSIRGLVTNRSLWLVRTNECGLPSLVKVISLLAGCNCSTLASSVLQLLRKHPIMKVRKTVHSSDNTSRTSFLVAFPSFLFSWLSHWMTKALNVTLIGDRLCSHTDSGDRSTGQGRPCRGQKGPQGEQNTEQWPLILKSRINQDLIESLFINLWLWNMCINLMNILIPRWLTRSGSTLPLVARLLEESRLVYLGKQFQRFETRRSQSGPNYIAH